MSNMLILSPFCLYISAVGTISSLVFSHYSIISFPLNTLYSLKQGVTKDVCCFNLNILLYINCVGFNKTE